MTQVRIAILIGAFQMRHSSFLRYKTRVGIVISLKAREPGRMTMSIGSDYMGAEVISSKPV